jgi:putative nucleotidyltransferase-like protein
MSHATHQPRRIARAEERHELGLRVAGLLKSSWRDHSKTPVNLSETELTEITPLLCQTGAGALAWSRLAHTPLAESDAGNTLHEVYRQSRLTALIHEREIVYVLGLLRAEGIEPVVVKGWAMSRLYPDRALRPFGDIDLCVRPDQFARATAALKCLESIDGHYVDLHCSFERIGQVQPFVQSPKSNVQSRS